VSAAADLPSSPSEEQQDQADDRDDDPDAPQDRDLGQEPDNLQDDAQDDYVRSLRSSLDGGTVAAPETSL
jgi:hypothetical protein